MAWIKQLEHCCHRCACRSRRTIQSTGSRRGACAPHWWRSLHSCRHPATAPLARWYAPHQTFLRLHSHQIVLVHMTWVLHATIRGSSYTSMILQQRKPCRRRPSAGLFKGGAEGPGAEVTIAAAYFWQCGAAGSHQCCTSAHAGA